MGASIEDYYLFELLSWTTARPHIHIHAPRTAMHRQDNILAMHELARAVNTWIGQCSEVASLCSEYMNWAVQWSEFEQAWDFWIQTKLYSL